LTATEDPVRGEIGRARPRVEDRRLITGAGRFVDDLRLPRTLELGFARSPYPHARIESIDVSAAAAAPGVVCVLTGADIPPVTRLPIIPVSADLRIPPFDTLSTEYVRCVGMPVAAVVAETRGQAADAAALIQVEYAPLDAVVDAEAALERGAPLVYPELESNVAYTLSRSSGDVDAAFASAEHTVSLRIAFPRIAAVPLEPRAILAQFEAASDELRVWVTTQTPHGTRALLGEIFGLPENRVHVVAPDVGGGFGSRSAVYPEYVVAVEASRRLGRPVHWVATRSEDVATTTHARDEVVHVDLAADAEGRLLGLRARAVGNLGAFLYGNTQVPPARLPAMLPGCYRIPNYRVDLVTAFTNTNPTGPYRGAGRPESADTVERAVDALSRKMGVDAIELRKRNFVPPEAFPYKTASGVTYDSGNYAGALDRVLAAANYLGLREQQQQERTRGERTLMGIGFAVFVEPSGSGWESGEVRVEPSGRVTVATGSSAHGQGHETSMAQIVADRLGIPFDHVLVRHSDTSAVPPGVGTFGSRSTVVGGTALVRASTEVAAKARRIAAGLLEANPDDVRLEAGRFEIAGVADRAVTWTQVAAAAYGRGKLPPGESMGLAATAYFQAGGDTFGFGAALAVVRIDPDTGHLSVERLVAVDDCGTVVNPLLVEGQVLGGTAQGLGEALLEEIVYEPDGGLATGSLMHYALPRASDIPPFDLIEMVTPSPLNPLGVKGVGESGTIIGTGPIMNAVADALAPLGIEHLDMPYTAERVWQAIRSANQASRAS
jgi:carbon-monoxide dehydrogenase large subunit